MEIWKDVMSEMPHPYPELAKKMILTSSEDEYHNITYELIQKERKIEIYVDIKINIFSCLLIINHPLARGPTPE